MQGCGVTSCLGVDVVEGVEVGDYRLRGFVDVVRRGEALQIVHRDFFVGVTRVFDMFEDAVGQPVLPDLYFHIVSKSSVCMVSMLNSPLGKAVSMSSVRSRERIFIRLFAMSPLPLEPCSRSTHAVQ